MTGLFLFLQFKVFDGIYLSFMWIRMGINANSKKEFTESLKKISRKQGIFKLTFEKFYPRGKIYTKPKI